MISLVPISTLQSSQTGESMTLVGTSESNLGMAFDSGINLRVLSDIFINNMFAFIPQCNRAQPGQQPCSQFSGEAPIDNRCPYQRVGRIKQCSIKRGRLYSPNLSGLFYHFSIDPSVYTFLLLFYHGFRFYPGYVREDLSSEMGRSLIGGSRCI